MRETLASCSALFAAEDRKIIAGGLREPLPALQLVRSAGAPSPQPCWSPARRTFDMEQCVYEPDLKLGLLAARRGKRGHLTESAGGAAPRPQLAPSASIIGASPCPQNPSAFSIRPAVSERQRAIASGSGISGSTAWHGATVSHRDQARRRRAAQRLLLRAPVDQQSQYTAQWTCSRVMGLICCLATGRSRNTPVAATLRATAMPAAIRYFCICPLFPDCILCFLRQSAMPDGPFMVAVDLDGIIVNSRRPLIWYAKEFSAMAQSPTAKAI